MHKCCDPSGDLFSVLELLLGVEKRGRDMRMEGKQAYIGGGTVSRSVYRKEKMGAPKKPPTYLHIQIESGAHQVGQTPENVNTWKSSPKTGKTPDQQSSLLLFEILKLQKDQYK